MDTGKVLGQIATRIRDQRLLFLIAVIVAVTILGRTETISALGVIIIFGVSAAVVVVDRALEFLGGRTSVARGGPGGFPVIVVPDLEGVPEGEFIPMRERAEYTIQDPRNPGRPQVKEVLLHEGPGGSGWLYPIPFEAGPNDLVSFVLTAADGRRWQLNVVPSTLWSRKLARRIP